MNLFFKKFVQTVVKVLQKEGIVSTIRGNLTVHEYLVSSDNWIAFRFHSDNEVSSSGFRASFRGIN